MKKKWILSLLIGGVLLLFANSFYKLEYNMTLLDFFIGDSWLTPEEQAYLKDRGDLIYGADQNSPPLRYVNPETGQYEGLVIDYLSALSMELGVNIQRRPMVWNDALKAIGTGETDFCDMYASKERSKLFLFTDPIYYQRGAILVKRGEGQIRQKSDLEGKKIAAIQGDYVFEYLKDEYQQVKTLPTADLRTAIHALELGTVEAVLGDESVINFYLTRENLSADYVLLGDYLYEREAVIGVDKEQRTLLNILNKAIYRLNKQNTMDRIYEKWFGNQPLITKNKNVDKYLLVIQFIVVAAGLSALALYYWNRQLQREVKRQTEALKLSHEELEKAFSEYKLAERRMMQSTKMAAVGQLAAGIAHEIRTPLGIIRNAAFILKRSLQGSEQVEVIEQSVERANKIIDNLLNFSRISDDRVSEVELEAFIKGLWELNQKAWQVQGIAFKLLSERPHREVVYVESLKHVLLNLFSNAADAMAEGGELTVSVYEDQGLCISVADTGSGMSRETIDQLFDPFFTTKANSKGTGLGLYIVYNEIQKMGGQISVTSKLGGGSRFVVCLPKAPQEEL